MKSKSEVINNMKIGIITGDHKRNQTGIGNYCFEMIKYLKHKNSVSLIKHSSGDDEPGCDTIISNFPPGNFSYLLWSMSLSLHRDKLKDFDIIHNPSQYPVIPMGKKYVITIHDLIPVLYPQMVGKIHANAFKKYIPYIIKHSSKIISISKSTKNDIIRLYSINPDKIDVIPNGVSESFKIMPSSLLNEFRERYKLTNPYILFVGALEPKKNIPNLIKSFFYLLQEKPEFELIIAGKKSWYYEDIFQTIKNLGIQTQVRFLNYVTSEDLPLLYNAAEIFVFPSIYEGFGLPPLEAMKCGTPVITSNVSSLPEVMGEKGIMVEPDDPVALCEAMKKLIQDISFREDQVKYGLERSRQFSWEKTADMTLEVYKKVTESE